MKKILVLIGACLLVGCGSPNRDTCIVYNGQFMSYDDAMANRFGTTDGIDTTVALAMCSNLAKAIVANSPSNKGSISCICKDNQTYTVKSYGKDRMCGYFANTQHPFAYENGTTCNSIPEYP